MEISRWNMKRILVTGATGYIGSHLCKILKERGHDVVGFDINYHGEYNDVNPYVDMLWRRDITERGFHGSYDAVVHLAGRSVVPQSLKEPYEYYRVNTIGTATLIDSVDTDHVIFASTSSAFEMASPYARSKVGAEDIIKEKARGYTIFRFFNVSGSDGIHRQLGSASHLIRRAALVATGKIPNIQVFGQDYDTRDGTCIRDYIHVIDVCNAIVTAIDNGPLNTPYECLGSNHGWTVNEVLDTMQQVTGIRINREVVDRRPGDAVASVVDKLSQYCNLTKTIEDMCLDQYKLEDAK